MAEDFDSIKKEIQEKNKLIEKLSKCKNMDSNKLLQSKRELDKLLYIYYKCITRGNSIKAFL